jgi:hypothetical protein
MKGALDRVAEVLRQWTAVTEEKVRSQKALNLHKEEAFGRLRRIGKPASWPVLSI